jgi:hypothetical protein
VVQRTTSTTCAGDDVEAAHGVAAVGADESLPEAGAWTWLRLLNRPGWRDRCVEDGPRLGCSHLLVHAGGSNESTSRRTHSGGGIDGTIYGGGDDCLLAVVAASHNSHADVSARRYSDGRPWRNNVGWYALP